MSIPIILLVLGRIQKLLCKTVQDFAKSFCCIAGGDGQSEGGDGLGIFKRVYVHGNNGNSIRGGGHIIAIWVRRGRASRVRAPRSFVGLIHQRQACRI